MNNIPLQPALLPEVVNEVFEDVHHVGRDVVEGDGEVTHVTKPLILRRTRCDDMCTCLIYCSYDIF